MNTRNARDDDIVTVDANSVEVWTVDGTPIRFWCASQAEAEDLAIRLVNAIRGWAGEDVE